MGFLTNLIFGPSYSARARRDQRSFGTSFKNLISPVNSYGKCFSCEGSGTRILVCRACDSTGTHRGTCRNCWGTGRWTLPEKSCPTCLGSGLFGKHQCRRCSGQGRLASISSDCKRCQGDGTFSCACKKCEGDGEFEVSCRKCDGSGWHRF